MAEYDYSLSSTSTLTKLEDMTPSIFPPKHEMINYSRPTQLGDGSVVGLGWLTTAWHWDYLSHAQYTKLKSFCSGLSAPVYIKTKNNSGSYSCYTAIMVWPPIEPEVEHGFVLDVRIEFRALTEYTP